MYSLRELYLGHCPQQRLHRAVTPAAVAEPRPMKLAELVETLHPVNTPSFVFTTGRVSPLFCFLTSAGANVFIRVRREVSVGCGELLPPLLEWPLGPPPNGSAPPARVYH